MPIAPDPRLELLAEAVADETPVDWERALRETPEATATLGNLRALEALGRLGRAGDAESPAPDPAGADALFTWGPLVARARLGAGSFGEVWRAWDPSLRREVALKLRHRSAAVGSDRRWLDEARRLARVRHPNVLVVHGADVHDGRAGLWTDLLQGSTLEELLATRGAFGAREAALIGIELCGALAAVHAAGLVHGDVKTGNVMREGEAGTPDGSGRIVLMDFGSAHETGPGAPGDGAGAFGTPLATAPEVLAGAVPTAAADQYALGVLLYRLVTGHFPVEARTVAELRERLARGCRTPLRAARPDLPAAFVQAVERALDPTPEGRHPDVAALEAALAATLAPGLATRHTPAAAGWRGRTRLVLALGLVAAAAAFLLLRPTSAPPHAPATEQAGAVPPAGAPPVGADAGAAGQVAVTIPPQVDAQLIRGEPELREPLRDGDVVAPGDRIALELSAAEPVHAYVLAEDDAGGVFVLFPLRDRGARNPLSAGARHRLPGRAGGADLDWVVTSAGGRETFLLLAARRPLALVEAAVARMPAARETEAVRYAPLSPEALEGLRAVGGVAAQPAGPEPQGARRLAALADALERDPGGRAVWKRLVVLENPAP